MQGIAGGVVGETSVLLGTGALLVIVNWRVIVEVEAGAVDCAGGVYAAGVMVDGQPVMMAGFFSIYGAHRPIR